MRKVSIELRGVFDSQAAGKVGAALGSAKRGGSALVDFTRVREFHDAGLAILARTIRESSQSVQLDLRGLREQQRRLLRYLGVQFPDEGLLEEHEHL